MMSGLAGTVTSHAYLHGRLLSEAAPNALRELFRAKAPWMSNFVTHQAHRKILPAAPQPLCCVPSGASVDQTSSPACELDGAACDISD